MARPERLPRGKQRNKFTSGVSIQRRLMLAILQCRMEQTRNIRRLRLTETDSFSSRGLKAWVGNEVEAYTGRCLKTVSLSPMPGASMACQSGVSLHPTLDEMGTLLFSTDESNVVPSEAALTLRRS